MKKSITAVPPKTVFVCNDPKLGFVPLAYWCKKHRVKYNTIQARLWRAGFSGNEVGLVMLDVVGTHKEFFEKVRKVENGD